MSSFEFRSLACSRTIGSNGVPDKGFTFGSRTLPALEALLLLPLRFEQFAADVDTGTDDDVTEEAVVDDGCEVYGPEDDDAAVPVDDDGMMVPTDDESDDEMAAAGWR